MKLPIFLISAVLLCFAGSQANALDTEMFCTGKIYGKGKKAICLPLGELSFADQLVHFSPGKKASKAPFDQGAQALGEPNYKNTRSPDFISLGCDGELVLQFTDNVLVDVPGMDLYVFEVGPFVEKTALFISQDGEQWLPIGTIEGSRSDIDIAPLVPAGERYNFVRLVNAGKSCGGQHSGADIDAVAAVGAEVRLSLNSAVLFDVGQSDLKPEADQELQQLAKALASYGDKAAITIEGHTDSTGSEADNLKLSQARAEAVRIYLVTKTGTDGDRLSTKGYGEKRPVASNDDEQGRALNRRVDVLVAPKR
ncbi:OmpA family protein [Permianibacter aggregans]|uniref:OmpA family protein n=1 Tax=Permianibacter aggregans TaxID=1510150 RepID=A0A4R6UQ35_9GAMM|nr:OmpA family protein [Permianibacter aggregans]QGX40057.1 OmpA family protein [Permianibacter aggregans]TDQ49131.1 OmpA family protein [Permianibacter aggregans]